MVAVEGFEPSHPLWDRVMSPAQLAILCDTAIIFTAVVKNNNIEFLTTTEKFTNY